MATAAHAEELLSAEEFRLRRNGRFLLAELLMPHRVLSTSVRNGGQTEHVRFLLNHQSCEGADHRERHTAMMGQGLDAYHDAICRQNGIDPDATASMGTAANMNYASVVRATDAHVTVAAIVTAGVQGNATCAGDPAAWREAESGWEKVAPLDGTINTILLVNHSLTEAALARSVVTMTEGKSAALGRLGIRSLYSQDFATGTGTDQFCIAAPFSKGTALTSASTHVKLGELIGAATRDATLEALRWQNGLEPSTTRWFFQALGKYGLAEATFLADIAPLLGERELELLKKNFNSVVYEPKVAAAAYAIAAVLDRIRYGTIPPSAAQDIFRQHVATIASSLAAQPARWPEFYERLGDADPEKPSGGVLAAVALGWSEKWRGV